MYKEKEKIFHNIMAAMDEYVNAFLDVKEAMHNAEEAMHNCFEQLLNGVMKNPSLCNNPRMKYLRDFVSYAERNRIFDKAEEAANETIQKQDNCSSISTNSPASVKGKESPINEKTEEEEDGEIERMEWYDADNLIQKYFLSETLERRQQKAQETMIANGIDPEDKYVNKSGERKRCTVCFKNRDPNVFRFQNKYHMRANEPKRGAKRWNYCPLADPPKFFHLIEIKRAGKKRENIRRKSVKREKERIQKRIDSNCTFTFDSIESLEDTLLDPQK